MSDDPKPSKANGAAAHTDGPLPPEPPPDTIADLAAACERFVFARYQVRLDRKKDTLSVLDQYARDARAEIALKPESVPLISAAIGAYFGEVVRGEFSAHWFVEGDYDGWRLDLVHVYLTFNPLGMAREALTLTDEEGWHAHLEMDEAEREGVEFRLSRLPEVDDEEFYLPTTRFEAIEIAIDCLREQMQARGLGDVTFGREDYRK